MSDAPTKSLSDFGEQRRASGLTQQQAADLLGVSQPAVARYDREGAPEPIMRLWSYVRPKADAKGAA